MTTIGGELIALAARINSGEMLKAESVVEWAREHPKSALHDAFEWDDAKAAGEYRLHQARRLIAMHVVDVTGERKVISLTVDRAKGGGYRRVADVVLDPELSTVMLRDALGELKRVRAKYERLRSLAGVWREVDAAVRQYGEPNNDAVA